MIKFILMVPDSLKDTVLEQALAWRKAEGRVGIEVKELKQARDAARVPAAETAGLPELSQPAPVHPAVDAIVAAPAHDRSTKVYRVIDTATPIGPIPQSIRVYLIDHPNSTAKQIETATGRGKKSVESAIWMLRHKGIVRESERV